MTGLRDLRSIVEQEWRERAACAGSYADGIEFVDCGPIAGRDLIERFCWRCPVVGQCREVADAGAPYRTHDYVAGARYYERGEPVDGWEAA